MTSLMLGDNPFFAISHLGPEKTQEYLQDETRFTKARDVIRLAGDLKIRELMISSHDDSQELLEHTGYYSDAQATTLPDLVVNIPNVHQLNNEATKRGILGGFISASTTNRGQLQKVFKAMAGLPHGLAFTVVRAAIQTMIDPYPKEKVTYVCLHNIVTDLLLGIGKPFTFRVVADAIVSLGFKPAFISLNPILADQMLPRGVPLCTYYNLNGFNMCPSREEVLDFAKATQRPLWAMGVLSSGAIPVGKALQDHNLANFSRVIYATSSTDRLAQAGSIWQSRKEL